MDNCSIHYTHSAQEALSEAGILTVFLPPYSPDMNPAEELFSCVKYYLKKHDEILQHVSDPRPIIKASFQSMSTTDCIGWIRNSYIIICDAAQEKVP